MFRKILIANRGEIAVRIARACREMGVRSVAVYSDVDRASLHVRLADEAYPIGPAPSRESYLVIDKIIGAARYAGCDAIHPGYGFLAENPALARACADAGITFIGPTAEAMEKLGSKTAARHVARETNVPTVPGTLDPIETVDELILIARKTGFPVVLKAVAGGGGKGMRSVERESELAGAWRDASSEARNAFGDGRLYLEKYLLKPRHIEIQVLADQHGNMVYLGERECSVQRRHQKVIEEAPSPIMTPDLRRQMGEAAVKLARAGGYTNAGTVEFLVDAGRNFYFLEMNTRLQVEHPVTEMVTSTDLVKLQIRIAAGEQLPFAQEDVALRGHAIECRIYAEDPDNNFFPSPGKILERRVPSGPGIRLDDGVYAGWTVPNDYDPMLGKLIAWGAIALKRWPDCSGRLTNITRAESRRTFRFFAESSRQLIFRMAISTRAGWTIICGTGTNPTQPRRALIRSERNQQRCLRQRYGTPAKANPLKRTRLKASEPSRWKTEGRREQVDREPSR